MRSLLALLAVFLLPLALVPAGAVGQDPRPLTLEDYGPWSRINQVVLSPDGLWLAYAERPNDGDARFRVRQLDGDGAHEAVNGVGAEFSDDGRWVAFLTTPPEEEAEGMRESRTPVPRTLHVIDLRSGDRSEEAGVRSFTFSGDGRFLAIHRDRSDPDADHAGSDLLLRDLRASTVLSFGNVSEYGFNDAGSHLAYLVDAAGKAGNGVYVVTAADGRIRPMSTGPDRFEDLAWNEAGDALAVLRGTEPEGSVRRANVLVVAVDVPSAAPRVATYDPATDASFPEDYVLSELADTRWTEDGARVLVGIKAQEQEVEEGDEETADVDVWHWADDRLQSVQKVQADADRRYTYLSAYSVEADHFVRLATDAMRRVDVTDDGRWAIGRNDEAYRGDLTTEGGRADYVRLDPGTGDARVVVSGIRRPVGTSPDGEWFLYVKDGAVHATNLESLETTNLSTSTGIDFMDAEFDRVAERPAYGVGGWTEDGGVILYTRYDAYVVPLAGGPAQALTGDMGGREEIRFRVVRLDPDEDWVEPDGALLSAYGEWTKRSGYFRARPGGDPQELFFRDEMIGQVRKAADEDRVVFTRQTFQQFPDYWTSDLRFRDPRRVTDANPQIAEFAWGRRVLLDYVDERGNQLQATLALPAGYQEGERYPMIIYFYEKMSQRHHQFSMPVYDDRPHMSTYASNGYLVLMPDIVYDDGYPGSSALDDVTAAARRAIDLGYADPDRIALQGHSWGGYETSFILTQTDMFAAIVTGAPLTNLMSMNNILYKRTGSQNGPILQWSQGRMGDQPWDDFERWVSQSPVHHAPDISTPFLILHGTADGAVDWNQGLELYTAARRLGKEVILLSYPDEPHHLSKEPNQKDFQIRMKQFFDHYLMDAEAPEWMRTGIPFLEKGKDGTGTKKVIS
jgi:dipeptidyl aminopeptidase/acylaminoacyl peptidase